MAFVRARVRWATTIATATALLGVVACGEKCAPPPCPSNDRFDDNSCSCVASGAGNPGSAGSGATSYSICQPLDPVTSTVVLTSADVVDAGRAADGTMYVLTDEDSRLRVFVGTEAALSEQTALGTGQGDAGSGPFWTANYDDAQGEHITVEVQQDASGLHMGVAKGPLPGKGFDVGSLGEVLEPIAATDAVAIPTTSTRTYHLEYAGNTSTDVIAVVAPDHADSFDTFRVFFGPPEGVREQVLGMVSRGLSIPSSTSLTFTIDAGTASSRSASLDYGNGIAALTVDGKNTSLVDAAALPSDAVFQCR